MKATECAWSGTRAKTVFCNFYQRRRRDSKALPDVSCSAQGFMGGRPWPNPMETAVVFNAALLPEAWANDLGQSCAIRFRLRPIFSIPSQVRETGQYNGWVMQ